MNDPFVMSAWAKSQNVPEGLLITFGWQWCLLTGAWTGNGCHRLWYGHAQQTLALFAEDGVLKILHVESPGEFRVSSAEAMLAAIGD